MVGYGAGAYVLHLLDREGLSHWDLWPLRMQRLISSGDSYCRAPAFL